MGKNGSFLAGDVGGTKTRLAVFEQVGENFVRAQTEQYRSADYPNLQAIIKDFLSKVSTPIGRGCIGVPGPVANGEVRITNLPWHLSEREIESFTGLNRMRLVNDLVATAASLPFLSSEEISTIVASNESVDGGPAAVIAPGTGLGMGFFVRTSTSQTVLASEGGHVRFAPSTELEDQLLTYLRPREGYVSIESILCGPGIKNIFDFLYSKFPEKISTEALSKISGASDPTAIISEHALKKTSLLCEETLNLFVEVLANHCGNVAVTMVATGGIYLGGGIPPRIAALLTQENFRKAFLTRGKMSHLITKIPVYLIKNDYAALTGAASLAAATKD